MGSHQRFGLNVLPRLLIDRFSLCCVLLTIATPTYGAEKFDYDIKSPMVFLAGYNGGNCNGCEWIIAEGTITSETPALFKAYLEKKKPNRGASIQLNSPGGNLIAGIKLGELIRSAGLITLVGKTVGERASFDREAIKDEGEVAPESAKREPICASACVYAFVGGETRFATKAKIGVHQFYDGKSASDPLAKTASSIDRSADQLLAGLLLEYVIRMGIDPKLIAIASSVPPWGEMKWLTDQELTELKIDNSEVSYTPLSVEPFGTQGSFAETRSRSIYYSFHHRIYCKDRPDSVYLAFSFDAKGGNADYVKSMFEGVLSSSSIELGTSKGAQFFPSKLFGVVVTKGEQPTVQASTLVVGATMADFQAADRVSINSNLSKHEGNMAFWMSFPIKGDRRKIGIVARSCVK